MKIMVLSFLLMASGQAGAAFYSTEYLKELLDNCNSLPETFDATPENFSRIKDCGLSTGYILAIYDALDVMADRTLCPPRTLQSEQAVAVVSDWIHSHPERWSSSADESVTAALAGVWSCAH